MRNRNFYYFYKSHCKRETCYKLRQYPFFTGETCCSFLYLCAKISWYHLLPPRRHPTSQSIALPFPLLCLSKEQEAVAPACPYNHFFLPPGRDCSSTENIVGWPIFIASQVLSPRGQAGAQVCCCQLNRGRCSWPKGNNSFGQQKSDPSQLPWQSQCSFVRSFCTDLLQEYNSVLCGAFALLHLCCSGLSCFHITNFERWINVKSGKLKILRELKVSTKNFVSVK